ncbi:hypothetical protein VTO42DRAFT_460 [Malbranchea cinnamomea]
MTTLNVGPRTSLHRFVILRPAPTNDEMTAAAPAGDQASGQRLSFLPALGQVRHTQRCSLGSGAVRESLAVSTGSYLHSTALALLCFACPALSRGIFAREQRVAGTVGPITFLSGHQLNNWMTFTSWNCRGAAVYMLGGDTERERERERERESGRTGRNAGKGPRKQRKQTGPVPKWTEARREKAVSISST